MASYIALAQGWGSGADLKRVSVDERRATISGSLYDALMALRRSEEPVFVWAEELCVEWEDDEDRARNEGIVKDVFGGAEKVGVWLGRKGGLVWVKGEVD